MQIQWTFMEPIKLKSYEYFRRVKFYEKIDIPFLKANLTKYRRPSIIINKFLYSFYRFGYIRIFKD
jgi:hypothetical protein